jgi:hypothetical protein
MDIEQQASLTREFMTVIAPTVAAHSLKALARHTYSLSPEESVSDHYMHLSDKNARLTIELASHLAARYADLHDAATNKAQKKNPLASR